MDSQIKLDKYMVENSLSEKYVQEFGPRFFDMSSATGCMGAKYVQKIGPIFFDMSSASGYIGSRYFQKIGPIFLTCPQLVGTWVQDMFRRFVSDFWHDSQMDLDLNISSL